MPKNHEKLLEKMKRTTANWKRSDLVGLLEGFGFIIRSGASHDLAYHPDHPGLVVTLPRHNTVANYVVRQATKAVEQLKALEG